MSTSTGNTKYGSGALQSNSTINGNNSPIEMSASVPKNVFAPKRTLSWRDNLHTVHEFITHNLSPRASNSSSPSVSKDSSPRVSKDLSPSVSKESSPLVSYHGESSPRFMNKQLSHISSPLLSNYHNMYFHQKHQNQILMFK